MQNFLIFSFIADRFIPHGHCYLWKPELLGLHLVSDSLIGLAYYSIPITLFYFVRKQQGLPFNKIFLLFGAFIVACGTTHLMDVWTLWHPTYWLAGSIKAITAVISVYTAAMLIFLLPKAREKFDTTEREQAEAALRQVKGELELRVAERTAELISVNEQLHAELSERKRIEEALRVSQARFAGILEIADDAVISVDGNQCITLFNQGAEKIFGYTAQEAIDKPLNVLLPTRFAAVHQQHVTDFSKAPMEARRMGERREIYGRRKSGEEFPAEASISKLQLKGETIFTVILRDVSDRKVIERMKDEFISVVSHELRTPLTSIHGSLGMLASGLLEAEPETGRRLLEIAVDSTERLVRLINDVLDVERIESGKATMVKQTCNVADLMNNATDVMQSMASMFCITLSVAPVFVEVWADPDRIIQTLTNLLSNAIKFSPQGATVWLTAERQDGTVLFQIRDRGRGIPLDKLETIFERFQQVDASDSRNQDGTGLGLAICRTIVQQHGGRIWAESILGEGSTFYFTLPVCKQEESDE